VSDEKRQKILRAAFDVFLRYGYRRVTMDDIAQQAGMSRPALYLTFPNKEAIFRDVVDMGHLGVFRDIESGLAQADSLAAKLEHVFEIWSVRSYEMVARSPAAGELMSDSFSFAKDVFDRAAERLAAIIADIIRAAVEQPDAVRPSAEARARIMIAAAHGFKSAAKDTHDMRALIQDLVRITVTGLPIDTQPARSPRDPIRRTRARKKRF
jgi:AcrR family transcriptional regulator